MPQAGLRKYSSSLERLELWVLLSSTCQRWRAYCRPHRRPITREETERKSGLRAENDYFDSSVLYALGRKKTTSLTTSRKRGILRRPRASLSRTEHIVGGVHRTTIGQKSCPACEHSGSAVHIPRTTAEMTQHYINPCGRTRTKGY